MVKTKPNADQLAANVHPLIRGYITASVLEAMEKINTRLDAIEAKQSGQDREISNVAGSFEARISTAVSKRLAVEIAKRDIRDMIDAAVVDIIASLPAPQPVQPADGGEYA